MIKTHTKYVLFGGCDIARSPCQSVTESIEKLAEEMSPITCQEMTGYVSGGMEKTNSQSPGLKDCWHFPIVAAES